jgi:hypothetical protein
MQVKAIMEAQEDPIKMMEQAFPPPHSEQPKAPEYFTFYRPENAIVTVNGMKFEALSE